MGLKAWKEKLQEIEMSEYDAELYEKFSDNVKQQVQSLRIILDSLQVRARRALHLWIPDHTAEFDF